MQGSNNPPVENDTSVCFVLKRATGEIEIRALTPERLWAEQLRHPDYKFEDHRQLNALLWSVQGAK